MYTCTKCYRILCLLDSSSRCYEEQIALIEGLAGKCLKQLAELSVEEELLEQVMAVAETWPAEQAEEAPSQGTKLGLDSKDRFYGRMSGVEATWKCRGEA